ncbi:MAG: DUF559 domain-containing protein [Phycisphaeraceae bacterium]|nr:DUF559 domain-containing protein [Phycisphaeraceae bacterium]
MHAPRGDWRTDLRAARLRRESSPPERILWSRLRNAKLGGLKFRRQRSLGPYILDFFCAEALLCIEIDGHCHAHRRDHDARRDEYLRERGVHTLRIAASEVTKNPDGVLMHILRLARARIEEKEKSETEEGSPEKA